jgi:hypothetical protein
VLRPRISPPMWLPLAVIDEGPRWVRDETLNAPSRFWIALYRQERIVIMDACKLSSTRWVASRACADLPTPGTVG